MRNKFGINSFIIFALLLQTGVLRAQQQRPRRARESTPVITPGSRILPRGYVIPLRIESRLDSGVNRPGDRFIARVHETVTDEGGRMVLPANLEVRGHVAEVSPAQMRRRSGLISVTFDSLLMPDGRELALTGVLTSPDARERRNLRIDEEGNVEGQGGQAKRNTVFIGGGATAGAVIGAIAGGAAIGVGVGAAAGVVAVLLAKGKEAIVEPGTLVGLELTEGLDVTHTGVSVTRANSTVVPPLISNQPVVNQQSGSSSASKTQAPSTNPSPAPLPTPTVEPQLLKLSFVQAERVSGGSILIVATAETPTGSWHVKTEQAINQETLEIWVKGTPPETHTSKAASHPTVTTTVADPKSNIRRVVVHGLNGDRTVMLLPKTGGKP